MRLYKQERQKRQKSILEAALELSAEPGGWAALTRRGIALRAGCAEATVNARFGSMPLMRKMTMRAAISQSNQPVIAQGIVCGYPMCVKLPADVRAAALAHLR